MKNNEKLLHIELNYYLSKSKDLEQNIRELRSLSENIKGDLNKVYSINDFIDQKTKIFKKLNSITNNSDEIMNIYSKINSLFSLININEVNISKLAEEEESSLLFTNTHKEMINKNEIFESMLLKTEPNLNHNIHQNCSNKFSKGFSKKDLIVEKLVPIEFNNIKDNIIHQKISFNRNILNDNNYNQFATINDINIEDEGIKNKKSDEINLNQENFSKINNINYFPDISSVLKKKINFNYDYSDHFINNDINHQNDFNNDLIEVDKLLKNKNNTTSTNLIISNNNYEFEIPETNDVNLNYSSKSNATLANLKASKISDIILKISKDSHLNEFIKSKLGNKFLDQILDSKVTIKNIDNVEVLIGEYEKNKLDMGDKESNNKINNEDLLSNKKVENDLFECHSEIFPRVNHPCFYPYFGLDNNYSILRNNEDLEKSFSHSRYRVISSSMSNKLKIDKSKRSKEPFESKIKQYSNYVSKHPKYFDRPYQYGGASSINI